MKQAYSRMKYLFLFIFFIFINSNTKAQAFSLDTSFNLNYNFYFMGSNATVVGLNYDQDNKILIYGYFNDGYTNPSSALRLYKNGNLDTSWHYRWGDYVEFMELFNNEYLQYGENTIFKMSSNGNETDTSWTNNTHKDNVCGVYYCPYKLQDGSVLIGSDTCNFPDNKTRFFKRLLPNGRMDTNFSHKTNAPVFGITKYSTDKLLLYGGGQNGFTKYDNIPANVMCRIDTLGNLDTTFKSIFVSGYSSPIPYYIQNDGKIIVVGGFYINNNNQFQTMIRLNPDGSLDSTFNNFNNVDCNLYYWINTICPSTDNGYIIGGGFKQYQGYGRNAICKTDINGFIDTNYFAGLGIDSVYLNSSVLPHVNCIKKDTNDTYYVMGWFTYYNGVHVNPIIRLKGISAGINEIKQEKGMIKVYPNPTKDNLTIETNSNKEQRLEITNLIGQTVYTIYINKKATINTSAFANGVYILKLSSDKETVVRKFVKE